MGVHEGRAALNRASTDLVNRWLETKGVWADANAKEFEEKFLFSLEGDVKAAMSAMDELSRLLQQCKRDCE